MDKGENRDSNCLNLLLATQEEINSIYTLIHLEAQYFKWELLNTFWMIVIPGFDNNLLIDHCVTSFAFSMTRSLCCDKAFPKHWLNFTSCRSTTLSKSGAGSRRLKCLNDDLKSVIWIWTSVVFLNRFDLWPIGLLVNGNAMLYLSLDNFLFYFKQNIFFISCFTVYELMYTWLVHTLRRPKIALKFKVHTLKWP